MGGLGVESPFEPVGDLAAAAGFDELPDDAGIVVQNGHGEIVAVSAQAEEILGLSIDQMRGRTSQDPRWAAVDESGRFLPGADHPAMIALRTREAVVGSIMGVHRPGSDAAGHHVWLIVDAVPLFRGADSAPWAVVAVFRRVTGELLQTLTLRDSERLFRMIAEHSSDMVAWQVVEDSTFWWVSPASETVLGVEPDALIGTRADDRVHPEDRATMAEFLRTAAAGQHRALPVTVRMRHCDGQYRWIEITAHVLESTAPGPVQMITGHRDITDRVLAEHARDAAVRVFQLAIDHATAGVALCTLDGTLTAVNPALCTILGRSAADLVGHSLREFTARGGGVIAPAKPGVITHQETELRFVRPDGTTVWCLRTVIGLPGAAGRVNHLLVQLQDITSEKKAADQREHATVTDPLTGLPNRAVLQGRLARALAEARGTGTLVGVAFMDLDDFHRVNDTLGRDVGDDLLRAVGLRLLDTVRHSDMVVRLGSDEFVVVRSPLDTVGHLCDLAESLDDAVSQPFSMHGQTLRISASIGTAAGSDVTANQLLVQAGEDMYRVKRMKRSGSDPTQ